MYSTYRYQCDVCLDLLPKRLIALDLKEKLLAKVFLRKIPRHISKSCRDCFMRLYYFKNFVKKKLNEKKQKSTILMEKPNNDEHEFNCDCVDCQNKRGNLPLLVQVIENQNEGTSGAIEQLEPQPSTSEEKATVSKRKQIKCAHCEKIFTHKGDYNKHLRKHTGVQPFACTVCDKKFGLTSNLQRHMRIHSGNRPYVCEKCNKRFNRKDKLDAHMKSRQCKAKTDQ